MFLSIYLCIATGKNEEVKKRQALFNIVCIIIYLQILKMSLNNIIRNTGKINVQSKINTNKYKQKTKKLSFTFAFSQVCLVPPGVI